MDDLDALLADLQNTISASPGYHKLHSKDPLYANPSRENQVTPPPSHHLSLKRQPSGPHSPHPSSPPPVSASLNNNLNELDSLLQDLSSHKYAPPSRGELSPSPSPVNCARTASELGSSSSSPVHKGKESPYAPPPLDTTVKGSPASPSPAHFHPSSNSTALVPTSPAPATMNGTLDSSSSSRDHAHFHNGHTSVDSLLDELNASIPDSEKGKHMVTKLLMEELTTTTTTTVRPTASSATRELDDLMSSLSDFKLAPSQHLERSVTDSSTAYPAVHQNGQQLDCMLDSLTADMSRQGVTTTQKGCCSSCDKPIVGQVITALGKTWHPEHFTCTHCSQELGTRNFFERDSRPYCEPDYHNLFSPRCSYCNGPILDKCVTALEKTWHTEHFFCAQCGKQFGEDGFHEKEGKPYCKEDYFDLFAPKCAGCNRAIMENYVSALNGQWHSTCFVCRDCKKPVTGKSFYAMEGKPVCPKCVGVDEEEEA